MNGVNIDNEGDIDLQLKISWIRSYQVKSQIKMKELKLIIIFIVTSILI